MFIINKSIIKKFVTFNHCFWLKYESSIYNIAFSMLDQASFTSEISPKQICLWILMREDNRGWTFSLEEDIN